MNFLGAIYAALAGACMSIQGVMNTRLSEKAGLFESNVYVQGTAFLLSIVAMLLFGKGSLMGVLQAKPIYWLGGVLGLFITVLVMLAMGDLTPTVAVSVILIAQLVVAALIDAFGIMDTQKLAFHWNKYVGVLLMVCGVILFKLKLSN